MQNLVRVALYGRVSGRVQADEATIETQVREMDALCRRNEWTIHDRYLDTKSRDNGPCDSIIPLEERPEGGRLLRDAERGLFDLVLVYDTWRWSRYSHISEPAIFRLRRWGVGFKSVCEHFDLDTDEGRLQYGIVTNVGQYAAAKIRRSTHAGKITWMTATYLDDADGNEYHYWMGGRTPYGYHVVTVNRRRGLRVSESLIPGTPWSEAAVIREIFHLAVELRLSCPSIAAWLNERGIPTYSFYGDGEPGRVRAEKRDARYPTWTAQRVYSLLTSPIYHGLHVIGKPASRWRLARRPQDKPYEPLPRTERRVPAIVDQTLWRQAQLRLAENQILAPRNRRHPYLLVGKVRCACGASCSGTRTYGKINHPTEGVWFYRCNAAKQPKAYQHRGTRCRNRPVREWIETVVWNDILSFIREPGEALDALRAQTVGEAGQASRLQERIDVLARNKNVLRDLERQAHQDRLDGNLDARGLKLQLDLIAERAACNEQEIETLQAALVECREVETRLERAEQFLRDLREKVDGAESWSWDLKRACVEVALKEVILHPPKALTRGAVPDVECVYIFDVNATVSGSCSRIENNTISIRHAWPAAA